MTGTLVAAAGPVATWHRISGGVVIGVVAVVLVGALGLVVRRYGPGSTVVPVGGLALAGAALLALERGPGTRADGRLALGIALLAAGPGAVAAAARARRLTPVVATGIRAVAAVPGALVTADAAVGAATQPWVRPLVVATVLIGGAAVVSSDRATAPSGTALVCLVGTLVACYTTVPDTEQAGLLAGVAVPFVLLGFPVALAGVGPGGYAVVGLLAWTAAVGGVGRPGAAVGTVAGLGVLLVLPAVRGLRGGRFRLPTRPLDPRSLALVAVQAVVVVLTARVAGLRDSLTGAATLAVPVLVLAAAATAVVGSPGRNAPPGPAPYHGEG